MLVLAMERSCTAKRDAAVQLVPLTTAADMLPAAGWLTCAPRQGEAAGRLFRRRGSSGDRRVAQVVAAEFRMKA
jgi:hypothetical protein